MGNNLIFEKVDWDNKQDTSNVFQYFAVACSTLLDMNTKVIQQANLLSAQFILQQVKDNVAAINLDQFILQNMNNKDLKLN